MATLDQPLSRLGNYLLLRKLGQGGMGTVYLSQHVKMRRPVAVKVLSAERFHDAHAVERFYREIEAISVLEHPNIVQAFDAGDVDDCHFLVMEFVDGLDVERLAVRHGKLSIADCCEIVRQAALGLQHAHARGLIHRDVKPSNLLMTSQGVVKLADMGLARCLTAGDEVAELTASGAIVGTIDYLSPELARGIREIDFRSDLYSLGCVLYRLLAGRLPFSGPDYSSVLKKLSGHAYDPVTPLSGIRADVPEELVEILDLLLQKNPLDRWASAGTLAEALAPFAAGANLARLAGQSAAVPPAADPLVDEDQWGIASAGASTKTFQVSADTQRNSDRPQPQTNRRRTWWGAGACAAAVGCIAVLYALSGNETVKPEIADEDPPAAAGLLLADASQPKTVLPDAGTFKADDPFENLKPDEIVPLKWYRLLNVQPTPLNWPNDGGVSNLKYDAKSQQLTVNVVGMALLSLGTVDASGFTFHVDIHQHDWPGKIGVFWGYDTREEVVGPVTRYQVIELCKMTGIAARTTPYMLTRTLEVISSKQGRPQSRTLGLSGEPWPHKLTDDSHLLELTVKQGSLSRVRLDGVDLKDLCDDALPPQTESIFHSGSFGLYTFSSAGSFRNARIMFEKPAEP